MFFTTVNLRLALEKEKHADVHPGDRLVREAGQLLSEKWEEEKRMLENAVSTTENHYYDPALLDPAGIFSLEAIRQICIKYRLRFLDFRHFKGELPREALSEIGKLEKKLGQPLTHLKIVAPSRLFHLQDKDSDPLLMLNLGNGRYYLIHQWGKDLHWTRKWVAYPFRSLMHFIGALVISAVIASQAAPIGSLPDVDAVGFFSIYRWYLFAFMLISFCSLSVFLLFTLRKNFSDQEWKNAYI